MCPAQAKPDHVPHVPLPSLQLPDPAVPQHANLIREGNADEKDATILKKLAARRLAILSLRLEAQQQAKELRRLHEQFSTESSSFMEALNLATTTNSSNSLVLTDQTTTLSTLKTEIEEARKIFDRSQERLIRKEILLEEEEGNLYNRYTGEKAISSLSDDISSAHSDLQSVAPSFSADEFPLGLEEADQLAAILETGDNAKLIEPGSPSQVELPFAPSPVPTNSLLDIDAILSGSLPLQPSINGELYPRQADVGHLSPFVAVLDSSVVQSPQNLAKLARSSKMTSLRDLTLLGYQFHTESQDQPSVPLNPHREVNLTSEHSSGSDYSLPRLSRWFAFGVPWSSFTWGRRHRPYRLPEGLSPWQAMTVNHYGAAALGIPISGELKLADDPDNRQPATRRSLLQSWFWDPEPHSDASSAHDSAEAEKAASEATSARKTPVAATMPMPGGSLSPTVLLEDGGHGSIILGGKSRFTDAPHTAQSDIFGFFKRTAAQR